MMGHSCAVEAEDCGPVFEVVAEITYVKDKVSDKGTFRERVAGLATKQEFRNLGTCP